MRRLVRDLRTLWWFVFGGGYDELRQAALEWREWLDDEGGWDASA